MIALTITTCKRYYLFYETLQSFLHNCKDLPIIDMVIHYDDSSSSVDRVRMHIDLMDTFKVPICHRYFDTIDTANRHAFIMKHWKQDLEQYGVDYVFHLEDDWFFIEPFSIGATLPVLKESEEIAYVGFSQPIRETTVYEIKTVGDYWEWIYDREKPIQESLFEDTAIIREHPNIGFWCNYINWPSFTFRPGVHDVEKLKKLDNFKLQLRFEMEFGIRYSKTYTSFNHKKRICKHIGKLSAYDLLQSNR